MSRSGRRRFAAALLLALAGSAVLGAEPVGAILQKAAALRGTPYRSGGIAPGGFDCSGFVSYLYRPTLPDLPRMSRDMAGRGEAVPSGSWRPGDLLFYATGRDPNRINHVAIWYGQGLIIHSISDGPETGVVLTPADARYWNRRYVSSRRVLPLTASGPGAAETVAEAGEPAAGGAAGTPTTPMAPAAPAEPVPDAPTAEESPWNDWEGFLRGDFEAWQAADEEAFEAYKRENG